MKLQSIPYSSIQMETEPQKVSHVGRTPIVAANPTGTKA